MPEGHTLHRLAAAQAELVGCAVDASSPQGRLGDLDAVDGRRLTDVSAFGKHLLQRFDGGPTVHTHLGMRGITLRSAPPVPPKPQVRLRLSTEEVAWDLIAPSRCELLDEVAVERLLGTLGPDPLRGDAGRSRFVDAASADDRPIGTVLLDQSVIAGVGNVFRAEVLHACRIHPRRPASDLTPDDLAAVWATARTLMADAVERGTIVTRPPDGRFVYKQSECGRCGTPVDVFDLAGRTAYACSGCQPA